MDLGVKREEEQPVVAQVLSVDARVIVIIQCIFGIIQILYTVSNYIHRHF